MRNSPKRIIAIALLGLSLLTFTLPVWSCGVGQGGVTKCDVAAER